MKAIVNKTDWPKFLKVNGAMERVSWNKYLLKPWKKGEIVKVVPYNEQKSGCSTPTEVFRKRYVNVIRKDEEGQWTLRYNWLRKILKCVVKVIYSVKLNPVCQNFA